MITIRSVYDITSFRVFQKHTLFKIFILSYICSILLLVTGVLLIYFQKQNYAMYLLSGVCLPIGVHVIYKIQEVETINKKRLLRDTTMQIFTFDEEGFSLEQISLQETFKENYLYSDIYSIIKYKEYYFLYINRIQAFVIKNEDYIKGNEEELDKLFKKMKNENFIVKRNSKKKK